MDEYKIKVDDVVDFVLSTLSELDAGVLIIDQEVFEVLQKDSKEGSLYTITDGRAQIKIRLKRV